MIAHECTKCADSAYFKHKECRSNRSIYLVVGLQSVKMQQLTMHDLKEFSNWMEKRRTAPHWYNPYNPLIKIDLVEREDRYVSCNDRVGEIQLDVKVQQLRNPEPHESLLMGMSDILLHELQRLIVEPGFPMKAFTCLSLKSVEPLPLPLTRTLGILINIPIFAYFPWTVPLTRTLLGMFDWMSEKWMMEQSLNHFVEFKLVFTLIHNE